MASDAYGQKPADTANIWYSPTLRQWQVCVLVVSRVDYYFTEDVSLKRERKSFDTFGECVKYLSENYKGYK